MQSKETASLRAASGDSFANGQTVQQYAKSSGTNISHKVTLADCCNLKCVDRLDTLATKVYNDLHLTR